MVKIIYIIRHAEAEGQDKDAVLTLRGESQAKELVDFFNNKNHTYIYSSPFKRAIQTIKHLAESVHKEVILEDNLRERLLSTTNFPDWKEKLAATFSDDDLSFEGGETSKEASVRIRKLVDELPTSSIIVTHGNIMALLLRSCDSSFGFTEWESLSNPDIFQLIIKANDISLKRIYNK